MLLITIEKMMPRQEDGVKTEDDVKTKHDEIINDEKYLYIGDEYKYLIAKIFKLGLMDGDLYLTNFDNRQLVLTKVIDKYLGEKILM